ncbi:MAG: sigma-70 family RNA polymerase sigma factor [Bacteroidota bacterium]
MTLGPLSVATLLALLLAVHRTVDLRELATRIQRGDHSAFRQFFETTHADLLRTLQRRGLDVATAEDVVQQAFVWIWEHRDRLDPEQSIRGLLFRIGLTRSLNARRDAGRTDPLPDLPLPDASSSGDAAALGELRDALAAAVADLPERRRQVFTLCFFDGLTHRDAAAALDISPKTVEHQMGHALKALRHALAPFVDG